MSRLDFNLFSDRVVCFDTETTGLGPTAEIVQISFLDYYGKDLLTRYIQPVDPISDEAIGVHGITQEVLTKNEAKYFDYYWPFIANGLTKNKVVIGYNVQYDVRMLNQSMSHYFSKDGFAPLAVIDVMQMASIAMGDPGWAKLSRASEFFEVHVPDSIGKFHDARYDAYCTLEIFRKIVEAKNG